MRGVLAVVVGFVVWSVLWLVSNAAGMALMPEAFDDEGLVRSMTALAVYLAASVFARWRRAGQRRRYRAAGRPAM